jgi:hypothetical protein
VNAPRIQDAREDIEAKEGTIWVKAIPTAMAETFHKKPSTPRI